MRCSREAVALPSRELPVPKQPGGTTASTHFVIRFLVDDLFCESHSQHWCKNLLTRIRLARTGLLPSPMETLYRARRGTTLKARPTYSGAASPAPARLTVNTWATAGGRGGVRHAPHPHTGRSATAARRPCRHARGAPTGGRPSAGPTTQVAAARGHLGGNAGAGGGQGRAGRGGRAGAVGGLRDRNRGAVSLTPPRHGNVTQCGARQPPPAVPCSASVRGSHPPRAHLKMSTDGNRVTRLEPISWGRGAGWGRHCRSPAWSEVLHLSSHTRLIQVLQGHPLADPKR